MLLFSVRLRRVVAGPHPVSLRWSLRHAAAHITCASHGAAASPGGLIAQPGLTATTGERRINPESI